MDARPPRSAPVRTLLALASVALAFALLVAALWLADTTLSIIERLRAAPTWLGVLVSLAFLGLLTGSGWIAWRLWRGPGRRPAAAPSSETRDGLEQRLSRARTRREGAALAHRLDRADALGDGDAIRVAMFGAASSGKTSLVRALTGRDDLVVDARAGSTREPAEYAFSHGEQALVLIDLPGIATGSTDDAVARDLAVAAHVVACVCEGDLTRREEQELAALLELGKPTVLVLNKRDRYDDSERARLRERLASRHGGRALLVEASGGGEEEIDVVLADGTRARRLRARPVQVGKLVAAFSALAADGRAALEPARQQAVVAHLSAELAAHEARWRVEDGAAIVSRYTRRAVVGAMAAVAPGSDLVIQGALAAAMLRELTTLHGRGLRELDLDAFVAQATRRVRASAAVLLAVAGNALKAFPGLGTVSGGLLHAVAYGLIFDGLGRAVAQALEQARPLDERALDRFEEALRAPGAARIAAVARLALGPKEPPA